MKNYAVVGLIALGLVASIGLGYLIYTDNKSATPNLPTNTNQNSNNQNQGNQGSFGQLSSNPPQQLDPVQQEALANFPGPDATNEQKAYHAQLVDQLSVDTKVLDIKDCNPNPFVIRVAPSDTMTLKNSGTGTHTIIIGDNSFAVAAGQERKLPVAATFGEGGISGYTCDNSQGSVGIIRVKAP